MEEEESLRTPFWQQQTTDTYWRSDDRRRTLRRTSSLILNSSLALLFLSVFVFCVVFIVLPSLLSFVSQMFRPRSVKKSWDSLNLVLVLFAILCGFLSRNYSANRGSYEGHRSVSNVSDRSQKSNSSTPRQWKGYSDRTAFNGTVNRLRSSSSLSDLLHQPSWDTSGADERWRFSDDTYLANYQFSGSGSDQLLHRHHRQELGQADLDLGEKRTPSKNTSIVDPESAPDFMPRSSSPPPFLPPPLSPPSSPPSNVTPPPPYTIPAAEVEKRKEKRRYKAAGNEGKAENREETVSKVRNLQPPEQIREEAVSEVKNLRLPEHPEPKSDKNEKKRGGATKDLLTALKRNKKKQRQKSAENFDTFFSPQSSSSTPLSPPSAPSLQSPSASLVFQSMFSSKKGKSKKSHSVPNRSPPERNPELKASKSEAPSLPLNSHKLQFPSNKINEVDGHGHPNSGSESPLFHIPKPPPLPPFKMPEWKFQVQGDFVRIKSSKTSPGTTLELEDGEGSSTTGETPSFKASRKDGTKTPVFCPSPDVNSKADNFIAMFRAGLELEKMNSFKKNQGRRRSNLGRERNPDTEQ